MITASSSSEYAQLRFVAQKLSHAGCDAFEPKAMLFKQIAVAATAIEKRFLHTNAADSGLASLCGGFTDR